MPVHAATGRAVATTTLCADVAVVGYIPHKTGPTLPSPSISSCLAPSSPPLRARCWLKLYVELWTGVLASTVSGCDGVSASAADILMLTCKTVKLRQVENKHDVRL